MKNFFKKIPTLTKLEEYSHYWKLVPWAIILMTLPFDWHESPGIPLLIENLLDSVGIFLLFREVMVWHRERRASIKFHLLSRMTNPTHELYHPLARTDEAKLREEIDYVFESNGPAFYK